MALGQIIAAALMASAPAQSGHVITNPDWLKKPTAEELRDAWPVEAYRKGVAGRAVLACGVSVAGLAENCSVVSETPAGMGFGAAALLLAKTFLFRPKTIDGTPAPDNVVVPISFTHPVSRHASASAVMVLGQPIFSAAPGFADLAAAYPARAAGRALYFDFRCDVAPGGELRQCDRKQSDSPVAGGEAAARRLLSKFRLDPRALPQHGNTPLRADVAIRLIDPTSAAFKSRTIAEPQWITTADPSKAVALFPPEAVAKGVKNGLGVARCTVAEDGALTACEPARSDPAGYGFDLAAVNVAKIMRMGIWTQGGGPVDGAVIDVPIRFRLAPDAASSSASPAGAPRGDAPPASPHQ